jgi:hypothetical protein
MAKRSNKQVGEILADTEAKVGSTADKQDLELDRKITLTTEGFTLKFCESLLRDRSRLSKENALVICDYVIAMKREINPRVNTVKNAIQFLSELSGCAGIDKKFEDMLSKRDDVLCYLDRCRKPENQDTLHKWIGSYNSKRIVLFRFFKWLYYSNVDDPKKRHELSALEKKPECIIGIAQLKRKEVSSYKPSDMWSQNDDLVFLKWVTNKRDRCYHTMSRDLSARPHEICMDDSAFIYETCSGDPRIYASMCNNAVIESILKTTKPSAEDLNRRAYEKAEVYVPLDYR